MLPDQKVVGNAAALRSVYATRDLNGRVPEAALPGGSDADPFSAGTPLPIFDPDGRAA